MEDSGGSTTTAGDPGPPRLLSTSFEDTVSGKETGNQLKDSRNAGSLERADSRTIHNPGCCTPPL